MKAEALHLVEIGRRAVADAPLASQGFMQAGVDFAPMSAARPWNMLTDRRAPAVADFQSFRTVNILWVTYSARSGPWGTPDVFRSNSK